MGHHDGRSDAELIQAGGEAFGVFYDRTVDDVLRYFMRRTGCAHTAADLTSETFAAALISRRRFRNVGKPGRAWLFTIAERQLGRYVRRERVASTARRRLGMQPLQPTTEDLERIETLVDLEPVRQALTDAVAALPASQRDAVRLRIGDSLPYAEIAHRLGCSEGAARVRVSRGLRVIADQTGGV